MKVLLVEDDSTLNQNISEALQAESIMVSSMHDGFFAEKILRNEYFDCVILDINLPGKNGFDVCRKFRQYNSKTPVIMLTAFSGIDDKVQGFNCGTDDYLTKPFYMRELLLRVHALTKRTTASDDLKTAIAADDITITPHNKKVVRQGQEISLTPREFQILMKLVSRKGELVSKKELIKEIWGTHLDVNTNTIEVYINFLRNKIDKPFGKHNIKTKTGYGYYFE
ncbi:response regulator transcription factor [Parafilimonas sp.]|uniref:response regulator transcription factor n=1 Tax=Parafilimonas sp. TaxID=1969739 RepID=UPI0039E2A79F